MLTTIPLEKETRDKLRQLARKSKSWNRILNGLYGDEITLKNANVFFDAQTLSLNEALKEIDSW